VDHYAREGASLFCGKCRRAPRVGRRRVMLTKVAQLGNRGLGASRLTRSSGGRRALERETIQRTRQRTFACFWVSLYILLPTYTCRCVSRRCSGLNILARHSRLSAAFHRALLCVSPLRIFFSFFFIFFLRIITTMARKQTRNPLVTGDPSPIAARIQNIPPCASSRSYARIPRRKIRLAETYIYFWRRS